MKEYIERAHVLKFINALLDCMDIVVNAPAADVVEVRHGRWEERPVNVDTPTTDLFCSECNFASYHWRYNYCPNCGAKMDKEE